MYLQIQVELEIGLEMPSRISGDDFKMYQMARMAKGQATKLGCWLLLRGFCLGETVGFSFRPIMGFKVHKALVMAGEPSVLNRKNPLVETRCS